MERLDSVSKVLVGMIVHHEKSGIGKIVEIDKECSTVTVSFMFFAPNVVFHEISVLWLVDARDVSVRYRNYEQGYGNLLKMEEVEVDEEDNNLTFNSNAFLIDDRYWSSRRDKYKQRRDGVNTEVQANRATEE